MPIYEGLTVDEAIQEGLHALGLNKDQAVIDVLDEGKKGFLGIGKKNARVSIERSAADESKIITESVTEIIEEILEPELEESVLTAKSQADTEEKPNAKDLSDDEALTHLALYLTNISKALNAPALVKTAREDGLIVFHLDTQKQGLLIGKHGKTLNALQYLHKYIFIESQQISYPWLLM